MRKLSYPSKRQASTTYFHRQPFINSWLSYPSKRQASTTYADDSFGDQVKVVIPIQTTGFYNPAERPTVHIVKVVIPIQTTGFYNVQTTNKVGYT